jgi:hypothetical protein
VIVEQSTYMRRTYVEEDYPGPDDNLCVDEGTSVS